MMTGNAPSSAGRKTLAQMVPPSRVGIATSCSSSSVYRMRLPPTGGRGSHLVERLGEVGDQVADVLDADGIADERVLDADLEALLGAELIEAHQGRLFDQALHAAERRGDTGDAARVDQP